MQDIKLLFSSSSNSTSEAKIIITKMKFLATFFSFFVIAITLIATAKGIIDERKENWNKITFECREKTGVSEDMVEKAQKGEEVDDSMMKLQILCVCVKTGTSTETDVHKEIDKIRLSHLVDKKFISGLDILSKCLHKHHKDEGFKFTAKQLLSLLD